MTRKQTVNTVVFVLAAFALGALTGVLATASHKEPKPDGQFPYAEGHDGWVHRGPEGVYRFLLYNHDGTAGGGLAVQLDRSLDGLAEGDNVRVSHWLCNRILVPSGRTFEEFLSNVHNERIYPVSPRPRPE